MLSVLPDVTQLDIGRMLELHALSHNSAIIWEIVWRFCFLGFMGFGVRSEGFISGLSVFGHMPLVGHVLPSAAWFCAFVKQECERVAVLAESVGMGTWLV